MANSRGSTAYYKSMKLSRICTLSSGKAFKIRQVVKALLISWFCGGAWVLQIVPALLDFWSPFWIAEGRLQAAEEGNQSDSCENLHSHLPQLILTISLSCSLL